jgi:hypothetical protein
MSGQLHALTALPPGKYPPYPLYSRQNGHRAVLDPVDYEKLLVLAGNPTPAVQAIALRYTDRPIPDHVNGLL